MGISTIASYRGAQLFEIVGLRRRGGRALLPGTISRIQGAALRRPGDGPAGAAPSGPGTPQPAARSGRTVEVRPRRRVPRLQPGRGPHPAGGGPDRRCTRRYQEFADR
ncbi:MAG: glutamate synthase central domain-containing protein [Arhodomonas sp.]|nr:glutamate synthase central domain-containing protein [Arhodomonas sp.]